MHIDQTQLNDVFGALGEQLAELGVAYEIVVIGGAGLQALGVIDRPTDDADVLALREGNTLKAPAPFPEPLRIAAERVAPDFGLDPGLLAAARWTRTHDPSEGFRGVLLRVLEHFGVSDADIPADLRD